MVGNVISSNLDMLVVVIVYDPVSHGVYVER